MFGPAPRFRLLLPFLRYWLVLFLIFAVTGHPLAEPVPSLRKVDDCEYSKIKEISNRLSTSPGKPVPGSGSAVLLENGVYGVSYDQIKTVDRSKIGDKVLVCLVSVPEDCPPGDTRGRVYTTVNLRTLKSWTLPDSPHSCGGA